MREHLVGHGRRCRAKVGEAGDTRQGEVAFELLYGLPVGLDLQSLGRVDLVFAQHASTVSQDQHHVRTAALLGEGDLDLYRSDLRRDAGKRELAEHKGFIRRTERFIDGERRRDEAGEVVLTRQ